MGSEYEMVCPKCGEDCCRDEVDVDVGIIYGPWGCFCGWSEYPEHDRSEGTSKAPLENPDYYVDSQGGLTPLATIKAGLERFGLPGDDIVRDHFSV